MFAFPPTNPDEAKLTTFSLLTVAPAWLLPFVASWVGAYAGVGVIVCGLVGVMVDQGGNDRYEVRVTPFEKRRVHILGGKWSVSLFVSFNPFRPLKKPS